MERSAQMYPDADLVLFQPKPTEHRLFTNLFRLHSRRKVCEIGYEQTRVDLWHRRETLGRSSRSMASRSAWSAWATPPKRVGLPGSSCGKGIQRG